MVSFNPLALIPDPAKAAADAAKAAADAAKATALTSPAAQAALDQARAAADKVGLGGVLNALEAALGIKPPKCTNPELIDHPKDDGIITESATATYQAITTGDAMFGYLHVDTTIPSSAAALAAGTAAAAGAVAGALGAGTTGSSTDTPAITVPEYLIKSKDNLWKLSIVSGVSLLIMSALFAKLK